MNRLNYILIGISLLAVSTSIFLGIKVQQNSALNREINLDSKNDELTSMNSDYLLVPDQYIEKGQYSRALEELRDFDSGNKEVQFRINVTEKLQNLTAQNAPEEQIVEKRITDTIEKVVLASPLETVNSDLDSLELELNKKNKTIQQLEEELTKISAGEYLTFQTTKGNELHYVGETKGGIANGRGIAILDSGSRYEGEWKNNMRHGSGLFIWADGERYEGEYKNDRKSGEGTYFWNNGEKYVGQWEDDRRNGQGTFYNKKGKVVARGLWEDDKLIKKDKKGK